MRKWNARLELEPLERRDNPSGLSDLWDGITYYGGAAWDGVKEGATNIATGARDAVVELVRTGGDVITIYTTDTDKLDPSQLNSKLFQGAAATAGNPQAAAQFDNQLVFGIATLGVGPLVQSGVKATETGDWSEFSHQAGGFGVMVLVPYAGVKGLNALPPMPVRVPVFQPSAALVTADGMLVAVPGGVAWETVAVVSFAVPVEAATALGGTGAVFAVVANGPGGGGEPNGGQSGAPQEVGSFVTPEEFAQLPETGTVDPKSIRFSQDSVSPNFKDGSNVAQLSDALKAGAADPSAVPPIRIVVKDGKVYTLDNRRLLAFQEAGIPIRYQKLDAVPTKELFKFTTKNEGVGIAVRGGN